MLMTKVALNTDSDWAASLLSRNGGSDDYQAGSSSALRLRGTFNPTLPSPCPQYLRWTPSCELCPHEVCSLLNLTFTKQGGIIPRGSKERGTTILKTWSAGCFSKCPWTHSANKTSWKLSQNVGPALLGQKWTAAPKPWTSWNAICYSITSGVWTWVFLSLSIEMFVWLMIHKYVKQKAPSGALHLRTLGAIFVLPSANHPG